MDDTAFLHMIDTALADAAVRGGHWLACRPGCSQCCHGVFAISALDASRLRTGLNELSLRDPERAARVRTRVTVACQDLAEGYPGDPATGLLYDDDQSRELFEEFANEAACPVLDPATQQCDLYASRPMTCRVFGPPVRTEDGIGVCELCFQGATESEVENGLVQLPDPDVEAALTEPWGPGRTIIAFALQEVQGAHELSQVHVR